MRGYVLSDVVILLLAFISACCTGCLYEVAIGPLRAIIALFLISLLTPLHALLVAVFPFVFIVLMS